MKTISCMKTVLLAVLLLGAMAGGRPRARADGIGVFPASLAFDQALRGGEYFQDVGIIHDFPGARTYTFVAEGTVAPWVSFADSMTRAPISTIAAPPRSRPLFLVRIGPPADVANGTYSGTIRVVTNDADVAGDESGSAVNIGVEIPVTVQVTGTQVVAGTLVDVAVKDTEVGTPLRVEATVRNDGNVSMVPDMQVRVVETSGVVVGEAAVDDQVIPPAESRVLVLQWDTARQPEGVYRATVEGRWRDLVLGSKEVSFRLVPFGSLSRGGDLGGVGIEDLLRPGEIARVTGTFRNTGQVDTEVALVGELHQEGRLIELIEGRERFVKVGSLDEIEAFFTVPAEGSYTLRLRAHFSGNETPEQVLSFVVAPAGYGAGMHWLPVTAVASGILLAMGGLVAGARFLLRRGSTKEVRA